MKGMSKYKNMYLQQDDTCRLHYVKLALNNTKYDCHDQQAAMQAYP